MLTPTNCLCLACVMCPFRLLGMLGAWKVGLVVCGPTRVDLGCALFFVLASLMEVVLLLSARGLMLAL